MIEKYIEKDIVRQVKVLEFLIELRKINFLEIANFLHVSRSTVKRDIERIIMLIPEMIVLEETSSDIEVQFTETITSYQLVKSLYDQSQFLRLCSYYLLGETNYMKFVEKEHISVAKSFNLRKKVEQFFFDSGIMNKNKIFLNNEFAIRSVILTIWMRNDLLEEKKDILLFMKAEKIVKQFMKEFSNLRDDREIHFFERAVYLSLRRKDKGLSFPKHEIDYVKQGIIFNKIKNILSDYQLNEEELVYISMMQRLLNKDWGNYQYLLMEYNLFRNSYIKNIKEMENLVNLFEKEFDRELFKDILFEKALLRYIYSTCINYNDFLVDKHCFLTKEQVELYEKIEQVMLVWIKDNDFNISFNKKMTEQFCLQVSDTLLNDRYKKKHIFIVASDEISHTAYREWLRKSLNTSYITIDNELYYSLEELPIYTEIESSMIICERSTIKESTTKSQLRIFPVSLNSMSKDLMEVFQYIFY